MKLTDRINRLTERINNISDTDIPDLVFIEPVPEGYKVTEDYFKRNSKGQVIRGGKRKEYYTTDSIDDISRLYFSRTAILIGGVDE